MYIDSNLYVTLNGITIHVQILWRYLFVFFGASSGKKLIYIGGRKAAISAVAVKIYQQLLTLKEIKQT